MDSDTEKRLRQYLGLLKKWQKSINLVSPGTLEVAWERHFEDSLQVSAFVPAPGAPPLAPPSAGGNKNSPPLTGEPGGEGQTVEKTCLFDLGSGAGFPGMVLAIARPDLDVTLIESDTKKCTFLSTVSRETSTALSIKNQRIESVSGDSVPAIITARALAPLDKLLGYCLPWTARNPDLVMLFLKGAQTEAELAQARQFYNFEADVFPSRTSADGRIVRIAGLGAVSGRF